MHLSDEIISELNAHALEAYPMEMVGVVADDAYVRLTNKSKTPESSFKVTATEFRKASKGATDLCLIHSHPYDMADDSEESQFIRLMKLDRRQPSKADMEMAKKLNVEFGIVCTEGETVSPVLFFNGTPAPLLERSFASGAHDDITLVCDWFALNRDVTLQNPPRDYGWTLNDPELDLYAQFIDLEFMTDIDQRDIQHGDVILMSTTTAIDGNINHCGVFLNDADDHSVVLHHPTHQLSTKESYYNYADDVVKVLRYVEATIDA